MEIELENGWIIRTSPKCFMLGKKVNLKGSMVYKPEYYYTTLPSLMKEYYNILLLENKKNKKGLKSIEEDIDFIDEKLKKSMREISKWYETHKSEIQDYYYYKLNNEEESEE